MLDASYSRMLLGMRARERIDYVVERTLGRDGWVIARGWVGRLFQELSMHYVTSLSYSELREPNNINYPVSLTGNVILSRTKTTLLKLLETLGFQEWGPLMNCAFWGNMDRLHTGLEQLYVLMRIRIGNTSNLMVNYWKTRQPVTNPNLPIYLLAYQQLLSAYQTAQTIAQAISLQPIKQIVPFRTLSSTIERGISSHDSPNRIKRLQLRCSGRFTGTVVARTRVLVVEKGGFSNMAYQIDSEAVVVATTSGIIGVKVWIAYKRAS